jgi:hypothetical protein
MTTSNNGFDGNYDAGGAVAKTIGVGVYGCFLNVLAEFVDQLKTINAGINAYIDANWKVVIDAGGGHTIAIRWDGVDATRDTALRDMLGFTGNLAAAQTHTATYTPQYCWLPTYQSADREYWGRRQADAFRGSMAQNGRLAGVTAGPTLYYRDFTFQYETAVKSYRSSADVVAEQTRTFEEFMEQCRQAQPTTSGNPNPKGFYYVPDRSIYTTATPSTAIPDTMTSGGVDFELDTGADVYVFCHADVEGAGDPTPAIENNKNYYELQFTAHTATAPTWTSA